MRVNESDLGSIDIEIEDRDILRYVASEYSPEEVFDEYELGSWATQNGFVPEDEKEE